MSRLSAVKKLVGFGLNKPINPLTTIFAGQLSAPVIKGLRDDLTGRTVAKEEDKTENLRKKLGRQHLAHLLARNARERTQHNLNFLKQNSPAIYDSVLAGRSLPEDAVVLGGTPRQDLLQELARNMQGPPADPNSPF
tara:strand:+ start:306 stop:716 length:411 start_codon:yes stop_codon:yes gene_type:complete